MLFELSSDQAFLKGNLHEHLPKEMFSRCNQEPHYLCISFDGQTSFKYCINKFQILKKIKIERQGSYWL